MTPAGLSATRCMPMVARGCDLWLTAPCVGTIPAAKERSEVASDTAQAAKTSGPGQRSLKQQVTAETRFLRAATGPQFAGAITSVLRNRRRDPMTPHQIDLVQSSFAKVAPIAEPAAVLFYERLFEIAD